MLRVILVDDEPLARERLRGLLHRADTEVELVAEAGSGREAIPLIHEHRPDLVLLDIQMPGLDGFDVVDLLAPPRPHIVFVTAFDTYALRAFEVHALDYLTKPVTLERLNRLLARIEALKERNASDEALDRLEASRAEAPLRRLTLQMGRRLRVTEPEEIRYFEAREKIVLAHLFEGKAYPTHFTIQTLERRLDHTAFLRIHRAFLVNLTAIRELSPWFSGTLQLGLDDGTKLPISRRRVRAVKQIINR